MLDHMRFRGKASQHGTSLPWWRQPPAAETDRANQVEEVLGGSRVDLSDTALARLSEALDGLALYMSEPVIPAGRVINPLLDVWDAAHSVDPYVGSPVEQLLTVLLTRTSVTPAELNSVLDEVRAAALQACALLDAFATT